MTCHENLVVKGKDNQLPPAWGEVTLVDWKALAWDESPERNHARLKRELRSVLIHVDPQSRKQSGMSKMFERLKDELRPGDFFESCNYHPMVFVAWGRNKDMLYGISLVDDKSRCCGDLCGVRKLSPSEAIRNRIYGLPPSLLDQEGGGFPNSSSSTEIELLERHFTKKYRRRR